MKKIFNSTRIYNEVMEEHKTFTELAIEYSLAEDVFLKKLSKELPDKLYSKAIRQNKKNLKKQEQKKQEKNNMAKTNSNDSRQEENNMTKTNSNDIRQEKNNMVKTNSKDSRQEKNDMAKINLNDLEEEKEILTQERLKNLQKKEKNFEILNILNSEKKDTLEVLKKAKKASKEVSKKIQNVLNVIQHTEQEVERLDLRISNIEKEIEEQQSKKIYLIAPGYSGELPELGTFYSTESNINYQLEILKVSKDFVIEPQLKEMLMAEYDSYKEYIKGLKFVSLCSELIVKGVEFEIFCEDSKINSLLQIYIA